jgi:hypothetical protein
MNLLDAPKMQGDRRHTNVHAKTRLKPGMQQLLLEGRLPQNTTFNLPKPRNPDRATLYRPSK